MKQLLKNFIISQLWKATERIIKNDQPFIIGISGSVGKTSTKEAIAQVLAQTKKEIIYAQSSFNTEFGIPLSLLSYETAPEGIGWLILIVKTWFKKSLGKKNYYLILEFGADKPGDIQFLTDKIKVNLAVLTTIAPTHLHEFGSIEAVAQEKFILIKNCQTNSLVILNADDPHQKKNFDQDKKALWYGIDSKTAFIKASKITATDNGTIFTLSVGSNSKEVNSKFLGKHQIYQLLAACAVGYLQKVSFSDIVKSLEELEPRPGRMKLIVGKRDLLIIDDTYNSSPVAVISALEVLKNFKVSKNSKGRKVAILGNMNELGDQEKHWHKEVGKFVAGRADNLIVCGPNAQEMALGARKAGMKPEKIITFETTEQLIRRLDDVLQRSDLVLIKASQNKMRFERIVKALMLQPEKSAKLLVRQSKYWQKKL